jgi:PRTRC genetic system protein B
MEIKGELLFLPGQLLLHWTEKGAHHYKLVSSHSVKAAFSHEPIDSGWLSSGIVRWGIGKSGNWVVKFVPPALHTLSFEEADFLSLPLPGLVFLGYGFQYYIFCIAESSFNPEAEVFTAPLPNVYPDGRICFGSTVPPACTPEEIDRVWKMFITSNFNSHLGSVKSKSYPDNIKTKLSQIATRKLKHYPIKDLNQYRSRVEQVIEQLIYPRYDW